MELERELDNTEHLRELGALLQRRLHILEQQAAYFGPRCPAEILMEIQDIKVKTGAFTGQIDVSLSSSYDKGKDLFEQFWSSIDHLQDKLGKAVIKEEKVIRIFGIPIFALIRTVTLLFFMAACGLAGFASTLFVPRGGTSSAPPATIPTSGLPTSTLDFSAGVTIMPVATELRYRPLYAAQSVGTLGPGRRVLVSGYTIDNIGQRWYRIGLPEYTESAVFWIPARIMVEGEQSETVYLDSDRPLSHKLFIPYEQAAKQR